MASARSHKVASASKTAAAAVILACMLSAARGLALSPSDPWGKPPKCFLQMTVVEVQSLDGPRHSPLLNALDAVNGKYPSRQLHFDNDIYLPVNDGFQPSSTKVGTQYGHCVETVLNESLQCYFTFAIADRGLITAYGKLDISTFATTTLTVTGGTAMYTRAIGSVTFSWGKPRASDKNPTNYYQFCLKF